LGDIDPIKAATQKLNYSNEEVIHYGIIPRSNRGIFAINELPDLQPRIQVGLLNIMEEREIQIRGFPLRIPMDILMVYSANPEDYTNRGNIITPLRDRIASQILTHYPKSREISLEITRQEAWIDREENKELLPLPFLLEELIEQIAFSARASEFVDQNSGVSARLTISAMENLLSNIERRCFLNRQKMAEEYPRIIDLYATLPSITGKIELVYEGEQDGIMEVAHRILGHAILELFQKYFPLDQEQQKLEETFKEIVEWFSQGNRLEIRDEATSEEYRKSLNSVRGLEKIVLKQRPKLSEKEKFFWMEFLLESLHQKSIIDRDHSFGKTLYQDMVRKMLEGI
ncbi:MAG: magnesium chelatase, partial [Planctomycetota bacterium]